MRVFGPARTDRPGARLARYVALPRLLDAVRLAGAYTGGQAEMLQSRLAEIPEWQAQRYEFARYAAHFLLSLLMFWPPLVPRTGLQILLLAAPSICVLCALLGASIALRGSRGAERDPTALFVLCGALALGVVMAIHLGFTFERHLETGWLKGIYPHYYFPLLPVFPPALPRRRARACAGQ
jgi:hypothetical protein